MKRESPEKGGFLPWQVLAGLWQIPGRFSGHFRIKGLHFSVFSRESDGFWQGR
jgi:hypothetical protein